MSRAHNGGWKYSNRKSRLPADWPSIRREVLSRCGGRCEVVTDGTRCPKRASDVDHIKAGDNHSMANLRGICAPHHADKSSAEGNAAQAARRARRFRAPEENPGRITGTPIPRQNKGF